MTDPAGAAGGGRGSRPARPPAPEPLPAPVADAHCHLDSGYYDHAGSDLTVEEALARASAVGVARVVQIGCELDSARWTVAEAVRHPAVVGAVALHPTEASALAAAGRLHPALDEIAGLAASCPRVRGIGETGLDYHHVGPEGRAAQEESFRAHIELAKRLGKTLVIHDRDAHDDVLRVLTDVGAPERTVFHCFSGDAEMARFCAARGWYLSFAGNLTFKSNTYLREALAVVPGELLLVETDAPYLAPEPYRGRPNASYLVPVIVRAMAKTRGDDLEALCRRLATNTEAAFGGTW